MVQPEVERVVARQEHEVEVERDADEAGLELVGRAVPVCGERRGHTDAVDGRDADLEHGVPDRPRDLGREDDGDRLAQEGVLQLPPLAVVELDPHEPRVASPDARRLVGDVAGLRGLDRLGQVLRHDGLDGAVGSDAALLEQDCPVAERPDRRHVVADEEDGTSLARDLAHLPQALRLELGVADREHLVDDEDVGVEVSGHREREPHVHPARVALHRRVDELLDAGEVDDLVELGGDLGPAHAENRPVQVHVVPAGQVLVEAGADLEQRREAPPDVGVALGRVGDPREDLEQRALAGAVPADDAEHLAVLEVERDVAKRPDRLLLRRRAEELAEARPRRRDEVLHGLAQRVRSLEVADPVALAEPLDADRRLACRASHPADSRRPFGSGAPVPARRRGRRRPETRLSPPRPRRRARRRPGAFRAGGSSRARRRSRRRSRPLRAQARRA